MALISEHDNTIEDDEQQACAGYRDLNQGGSESLPAAALQLDDKADDKADERSDAATSSVSAAAASTSASAATAAPSVSGSEAQETSSAASSAAHEEESELQRVLRQRRDRVDSIEKAAPAADPEARETNSASGSAEQEAAASTSKEAEVTSSASSSAAQEAAPSTDPDAQETSSASCPAADAAASSAAPQAAETSSASCPAAAAAASCAAPEATETSSASSSAAQEEPSPKLPKVPHGCIECIMDASAKEERAMVFDRAGAYPGAVNLYRESAGILSQALRSCPESHPDRSKIEVHMQEVLDRAAYLYSLGVEPAEIPLEQHIHGAALSMTSTREMQTTAAATVVGAATGLVLLGPVAGVALAAGAAYATTRQNGVGKVARGVGEAGLGAVDTAKKLNDKVRLDQKIDKTARAVDGRLQISDKAQRAKEAIQAVDEKYSVAKRYEETVKTADKFLKDIDEKTGWSRGVDAAAAKTMKAASDFNAKHQVTEKLSEGVSRAGSAVNEGVARAGSAVNEGVARAGSAVTSWVSKLAGSGRTPGANASSQFSQEPLG